MFGIIYFYSLYFNNFVADVLILSTNRMEKQQRKNSEEDQALWLLVQQGDKKAFVALFTKYYVPLCVYSRYYVSSEDAEELVQDLMVWLWEKRTLFVMDGGLQRYLFTAIKNKCLSILTRQHKDLPLDTFILNELDSFYEHFDYCVTKELEERIKKTIANLPESYREVFEMSRFQDKSRQKIAEELGVSIKVVDYRIQQALKILRIELKEYLFLFALLYRIF